MSRVLQAYRFLDRDPAVDAVKTLIQDHNAGKITPAGLKHIEESGGPRAATMKNWFHGKTKRPQNATLEAAGRALGYQRQWVKMKVGRAK